MRPFAALRPEIWTIWTQPDDLVVSNCCHDPSINGTTIISSWRSTDDYIGKPITYLVSAL
jgi:hypothetical protein